MHVSPRCDDHDTVWIPRSVEQQAVEIFHRQTQGFCGVFLRIDIPYNKRCFSLILRRNGGGREAIVFPKNEIRLRCLTAQYLRMGFFDAQYLARVSEDSMDSSDLDEHERQFKGFRELPCSYYLASAIGVLAESPRGCVDMGRAKFSLRMRLLRRRNAETWNYPLEALKEMKIYALFVRDKNGEIAHFLYRSFEGRTFHEEHLRAQEYVNLRTSLFPDSQTTKLRRFCHHDMKPFEGRGIYLTQSKRGKPILGVRRESKSRALVYVCRSTHHVVQLVKRFLREGLTFLNPPLLQNPQLVELVGGKDRCRQILDVTHLGSQGEPLEQFLNEEGESVLRMRLKEKATGLVFRTNSLMISLARCQLIFAGKDPEFQLTP